MTEFVGAIRNAGIEPPPAVHADGKLHRFHVAGDKPKTENGYYVLHDDPPAGAFGCWKRGIREKWSGRAYQTMTSDEQSRYRANMESARREREAEEVRVRVECRKKAKQIWDASKPAPADHPYLHRKQVSPHGVRVTSDGKLVIPVRGADGTLHGLQFIDQDGNKKFLTGTAKSGHYASIGGKPETVLYIAEGFATAATIHEATGAPVAVAFDAGNLTPVAKNLRAKISDDIQLVICADNDHGTEDNTGMLNASEAARAVNGLLAVPIFTETEHGPNDTDFNDLCRMSGACAVMKCIKAAAPPAKEKPVQAEYGGQQAEVEIVCAADIVARPVEWLWDGWLAAGKLHILAGAPGTGKSNLAFSLGATITTGGAWPDRTRCTDAGTVLIWSGEDSADDTIKPRLLANGADCSKVYIIRSVGTGETKRPFDPSTDLPALRPAMDRFKPKLLIVDSIVSAVSGDSHKNTETRRALQPLVDLGEKYGVAILGISHFSKGTANRDPVERVTGSLAFGALARIVLAAAKLPPDNEHGMERIFARAKSNIGVDTGAFGYSLPVIQTGELFATKVEWTGSIDGSARELLAEATDSLEDRGALADAKDFLLDYLVSSPQSVPAIMESAKKAGIAEKTLKRAKSDLKIVSEKCGMRNGWMWSLPRRGPNNPEEGQQNTVASFVKPWPPSQNVVNSDIPEVDW